jgi:hypothetical protein
MGPQDGVAVDQAVSLTFVVGDPMVEATRGASLASQLFGPIGVVVIPGPEPSVEYRPEG